MLRRHASPPSLSNACHETTPLLGAAPRPQLSQGRPILLWRNLSREPLFRSGRYPLSHVSVRVVSLGSFVRDLAKESSTLTSLQVLEHFNRLWNPRGMGDAVVVAGSQKETDRE